MNKDIIAFIEKTQDIYLLHLYPAIKPELDEQIEGIIRKYANIHFKENVQLSRRGLVNCKKISYSKQGDWIGGFKDGFFGLRKHAKKSIRGRRGPTRVYVITADNISKMVALKAEIRELIGKGTWPCHITDSQEEALTLARIYFNNNALLVCNGRRHTYDSASFDVRVDELKQRLENAGLPLDGIIGVGSTPLAIADIRRAKDFDYLAIDERYDAVLHDDIYSPHDSQLRRYPYSKKELIENCEHYFYYRGVKFISLDILAQMKRRRHEWPKDWRDYIKIKLFMLKSRLLASASAWKYII